MASCPVTAAAGLPWRRHGPADLLQRHAALAHDWGPVVAGSGAPVVPASPSAFR